MKQIESEEVIKELRRQLDEKTYECILKDIYIKKQAEEIEALISATKVDSISKEGQVVYDGI